MTARIRGLEVPPVLGLLVFACTLAGLLSGVSPISRFAVIEGGDYRRDTEEADAPGLIQFIS